MKDKDQYKVLIIEDDIELLEMLKEELSEHFQAIKTACDGASAYMAFRDEKFDLVISDIRMPGFNGIDLLVHVRAAGNNVPFIMVSGAAEKEDVMRALKLGVKDFVEKPYHLDKLVSTIFGVIEIEKREENLDELVEKYGEDDSRVQQQKKMIGLFRATNASKKAV